MIKAASGLVQALARQPRTAYSTAKLRRGSHMTSVDITTIETDGAHWLRVAVDGGELTPRGPFADADAAQAMANRFATICRSLDWPVNFHHTGPTPAVRQQRPR